MTRKITRLRDNRTFTRTTYNFNPGWRFLKGDCPGAEVPDFDDSNWEGADLPHGLEVLPENSSGCINYQGPAWYRKRFRLPGSMEGQRVFLRFEAIMGISRIWVNGRLVTEHVGGYLPIHVDIREYLQDGDNLVAVRCDNSNCPDVPPGKPQEVLDFCYFGGIYRDTDLIFCPDTYLTDANDPRFEQGGVHFRTLTAENDTSTFRCRVGCFTEADITEAELELRLVSPTKEIVYQETKTVGLSRGLDTSVAFDGTVKNPELWTPETPALYSVECRLKQGSEAVDLTRFRTGLRTIEPAGRDGLVLNGQPYDKKLSGVNRHQDYPHLGNAIGALLHERDAIKFHRAGYNLVRSAHYPQDRAFMDACDRLGILVIVATPGWQFFNENGPFIERVYSDIRQMIRRDRNRPSVFLWEPILNETRYTEAFAHGAFAAVRGEDPDRPFAADRNTPGSEACGIIYAPRIDDGEERPVLTREWGDGPDDWFNQAGRARMGYHQGEQAQLTQVRRYVDPANYEMQPAQLYRMQRHPAQYLGAALWAGIECQRGYHPDPFYGGVLSLYREEKFTYFFFQSQQGPDDIVPPMVFIANNMAPDSPEDVTVFTNCDEVILKLDGTEVGRRCPEFHAEKPIHPPLVFPKAFSWFRTLKRPHDDRPTLAAIGLIAGKEVCEHAVSRPGRKHALRIRPDFSGVTPRAGGEVLPFFVDVVDENGTRIPYAEEWIDIETKRTDFVVGEGCDVFLSPVRARYGSAPVLIRTGPFNGLLTITAKVKYPGAHTPKGDTYAIEIAGPKGQLCFDPDYRKESLRKISSKTTLESAGETNWQAKLKEVERDQEFFADTTQSIEGKGEGS